MGNTELQEIEERMERMNKEMAEIRNRLERSPLRLFMLSEEEPVEEEEKASKYGTCPACNGHAYIRIKHPGSESEDDYMYCKRCNATGRVKVEEEEPTTEVEPCVHCEAKQVSIDRLADGLMDIYRYVARMRNVEGEYPFAISSVVAAEIRRTCRNAVGFSKTQEEESGNNLATSEEHRLFAEFLEAKGAKRDPEEEGEPAEPERVEIIQCPECGHEWQDEPCAACGARDVVIAKLETELKGASTIDYRGKNQRMMNHGSSIGEDVYTSRS